MERCSAYVIVSLLVSDMILEFKTRTFDTMGYM